MTQKYGLVCPTFFQGITMSASDIYDTEAEANAELKDLEYDTLQSLNDEVEEGADGYTGFEVMPIYPDGQGGWKDEAGASIHVTAEES